MTIFEFNRVLGRRGFSKSGRIEIRKALAEVYAAEITNFRSMLYRDAAESRKNQAENFRLYLEDRITDPGVTRDGLIMPNLLTPIDVSNPKKESAICQNYIPKMS